MEKIQFESEDGVIDFYVVEQTRVNGQNYLLVTDAEEEEEDGDGYILKDISAEDAAEAVYEMVEDEEELMGVAKIFSELLEDVELVEE